MTRHAAPFRAYALLMLLALVACGASARERTLHATLTGLSAAGDGLVAWDATKQADIVASATSAADGEQRLAAYRKARARAVELFSAAFHALAAAAIVDKKEASLTTAVTAAAEAIKAYNELKGAP